MGHAGCALQAEALEATQIASPTSKKQEHEIPGWGRNTVTL